MTTDEYYMSRCLQLAKNGEMGAAPNPMVGAVIVCDGRIIGEGFHAHCGGPHAEVNAFNSVKDDSLLPESTLYVSLEPCAHFGKTPPCANLVVDKGVKRVVVGCIDPFAKVHGRGIKIIHDAGIDIKIGVLNRECQKLNRRFFVFHTCRRPYVVLKWAQTADGVMGIKSDENHRLQISTLPTMRRVHHLRAQNKAILVGYNTALHDNPSLTVRLVDGPNPLRIVVDPKGQLPSTLRVFDGSVPTLVVGHRKNNSVLANGNVEFLRVGKSENIYLQLMAELYERGVQSVMVEGGADTLREFLSLNLWDEAHVEYSPRKFGDLLPKGCLNAQPVYAPFINNKPVGKEPLGNSLIYHYMREKM